jgi:hypothetical protein
VGGDLAGVAFELREYEFDEEHFSAESVAAELHMAPETVFKTLIALGDQTGPLFAVIPAGAEATRSVQPRDDLLVGRSARQRHEPVDDAMPAALRRGACHR